MMLYRQIKVLEGIQTTVAGFGKLKEEEKNFHWLVDAGEFPRAIESLKKCKSQLKKYEKFPCLNATRTQLQDGFSLVEQKMEETLFQICHVFTPANFDRVLHAYYSMGKTFAVEEKLPKCFMSSLKSSMLEVLFSWVMRSAGPDCDPVKLKKLKFGDLVSHLSGGRPGALPPPRL